MAYKDDKDEPKEGAIAEGAIDEVLEETEDEDEVGFGGAAEGETDEKAWE